MVSLATDDFFLYFSLGGKIILCFYKEAFIWVMKHFMPKLSPCPSKVDKSFLPVTNRGGNWQAEAAASAGPFTYFAARDMIVVLVSSPALS